MGALFILAVIVLVVIHNPMAIGAIVFIALCLPLAGLHRDKPRSPDDNK